MPRAASLGGALELPMSVQFPPVELSDPAHRRLAFAVCEPHCCLQLRGVVYGFWDGEPCCSGDFRPHWITGAANCQQLAIPSGRGLGFTAPYFRRAAV